MDQMRYTSLMLIPPPDWSDLPFFLAVARRGSLRAAAGELGATHATVDRRLKALEQSYGVRLFDRATTGVSLTDAGIALLPLAEQAEDAMIAARMRVKGLDREARGTVRVSVPPALAQDSLPEILTDFAAAYPDIRCEVTVTNRFADIGRADADVSIRIAHEVTGDVVARRVLTYAAGIYASKDYLARHWPTRGEAGEGLHWIGWRDGTPDPRWKRDSPFPKAATRHDTRDPLLVAGLVRAGAGMSYLPCFAADRLPGVVRVPGTTVAADRSIWLVLHADVRRTTRVRLFVDFMVAALKADRGRFQCAP